MMTSLPPWLTPSHYEALTTIVGALDATQIPYVISGGLAGNLHGSTWPLQDIDLDVPQAALRMLAHTFADQLRFGPLAYADEEFELELLGLTVRDVEIDVSAAETVVLRSPDGARHAAPTDLGRWESRTLGTLSLRVLPLQDLLAYKRVIGRYADIRELTALAGR